ncbi:hypothetical protein ACU4GD_11460 [Cupriavidus basilensis]
MQPWDFPHGLSRPGSQRADAALAYHATVVDYLRSHEARCLALGQRPHRPAPKHLEALRLMLLRDTYRIDAEAHADVHAALARPWQRLGVDASGHAVPVPRAGDEAPSLVYVPGEVHIILQGPLLERLSAVELLAVFRP